MNRDVIKHAKFGLSALEEELSPHIREVNAEINNALRPESIALESVREQAAHARANFALLDSFIGTLPQVTACDSFYPGIAVDDIATAERARQVLVWREHSDLSFPRPFYVVGRYSTDRNSTMLLLFPAAPYSKKVVPRAIEVRQKLMERADQAWATPNSLTRGQINQLVDHADGRIKMHPDNMPNAVLLSNPDAYLINLGMPKTRAHYKHKRIYDKDMGLFNVIPTLNLLASALGRETELQHLYDAYESTTNETKDSVDNVIEEIGAELEP